MQLILTQLFNIVTIFSIAFFTIQFVRSIPQTPQPQVIVESPVVAANYATLDWFTEPTPQEQHDYWLGCEIESESCNVIELAKAKLRMPTRSLFNATIRELKKLASDRKIKNYSKMKKAELVLALQ